MGGARGAALSISSFGKKCFPVTSGSPVVCKQTNEKASFSFYFWFWFRCRPRLQKKEKDLTRRVISSARYVYISTRTWRQLRRLDLTKEMTCVPTRFMYLFFFSFRSRRPGSTSERLRNCARLERNFQPPRCRVPPISRPSEAARSFYEWASGGKQKQKEKEKRQTEESSPRVKSKQNKKRIL